MDLSPWDGIIPLRRPVGPRDARRRPSAGRKPEFEPLDNRRLLSTAAPAPAEFSKPSAAQVSSATGILRHVSPATFAQLQAAMTQAEQHAHINPADVSALAQDEAVVDQDIESSGIIPHNVGNDLNDVQDWVDYAFTYKSVGFHVGRHLHPLSSITVSLDHDLAYVPAVFHATGPDASTAPIRQLIDQIKVVARQSSVAPALRSALNRDYNVLNSDLESHANTVPGPDGTLRYALVVYYDGQVDHFAN
jgi:hypothetical protein